MTPVPVEEIKSGTDAFFCEPYRCTLLAQACVTRQAHATKGTKVDAFRQCRSCALGATVAARAGIEVDAVDIGAGADENRKRHGGWSSNMSRPRRLALVSPSPSADVAPVDTPAMNESASDVAANEAPQAEAAPLVESDLPPSVPEPSAPAPIAAPARATCSYVTRLPDGTENRCPTRLAASSLAHGDGMCGGHRQSYKQKHEDRAVRDDRSPARAAGTGQVFRKGGRWYAKAPESLEHGKRIARYIGSFGTAEEAYAACDAWVKEHGVKVDRVMPTCSYPGCTTNLNERSLLAEDGLCGVHRRDVALGQLKPSAPRDREKLGDQDLGDKLLAEAAPYAAYAELLRDGQHVAEQFGDAGLVIPARLQRFMADPITPKGERTVTLGKLDKLQRLRGALDATEKEKKPDDEAVWEEYLDLLYSATTERELFELATNGLLWELGGRQ